MYLFMYLFMYLWCRDTWHLINLCININYKVEPLVLNELIFYLVDVLNMLSNILSNVILNLTFSFFILYNALKLFLLFMLLIHIFLLPSEITNSSPFGACAINWPRLAASAQTLPLLKSDTTQFITASHSLSCI